ncbi:MAG TPA: DUF488 domain-containing protein [Polyangia bacterium]|nr:DUF488 domain-containing protein [Polyangia bacterium]
MISTAIWSIGHGNRSLDELARALEAHGVQALADVRSFPGSRRHPHFGREALAASLPSLGIDYTWWPDLGGRRKVRPDSIHVGWQVAAFRAYADYMETPRFQAALDLLLRAAAQRPSAFMCAERLWWQCHRRLLSDALAVRGLAVVHILDAHKGEPHKLTPFLHVDGERLVYRGLV